jgi:hypothetical protein
MSWVRILPLAVGTGGKKMKKNVNLSKYFKNMTEEYLALVQKFCKTFFRKTSLATLCKLGTRLIIRPFTPIKNFPLLIPFI